MDIETSEDRTTGIGDTEPPKEIEVRFGKGVTGTLAFPHAETDPNYLQKGYAPATTKIALLLHGQGGHRDYCYQKMLAHKLAAELGMYSLRIDFRGCGWLDENADPNVGRILEQDVEDIQAAVDYVTDGTRNEAKTNFLLLAMIAHSRGAVAMFLWACEQQKLLESNATAARAVVVPNLINCSLRFRSHTIRSRYHFLDDQDVEYVVQKALRFGKYADTRVPRLEIRSLANVDLSHIGQLSTEWSVLSVYGTEDHIISKEDCAYFANTLNRGPYSHHLELIDGADHNFYGNKAIENEDDKEDYNPLNLPLTKKNTVNYNYLVSAIVAKYLRYDQEIMRFNARSKTIGCVPRSKTVDGVSNFRDVGGWRIDQPTFKVTNSDKAKYYVRPSFIFRCANTARLSKKGAQSIKDLNIGTVFDLRSVEECAADGSPQGFLEEVGIKRVHAPVFRHEDYSPDQIALRFANLTISWHTYVHVYDHMLSAGHELFKQMFEYIRDHPDKPFLFHCTAGKDRTGVFAMLLLRLVGVDRHTIIKEYELTTLGLKPDHEDLRKKFVDGLAKAKAKEIELLTDTIVQGRENWTIEKDGFENLVSSRSEAMLATLELLDKKFGGILNYMREYLKFSDADIETIFKNLVYVVDHDVAVDASSNNFRGRISKF